MPLPTQTLNITLDALTTSLHIGPRTAASDMVGLVFPTYTITDGASATISQDDPSDASILTITRVDGASGVTTITATCADPSEPDNADRVMTTVILVQVDVFCLDQLMLQGLGY